MAVAVAVAVVVSISSPKLLWTVLFTRCNGSQLDSLSPRVLSFLIIFHSCCDESFLTSMLLSTPPETSTFIVVFVVEGGLFGFLENIASPPTDVEEPLPLETTRKFWRAESKPLVASLKERDDFFKLSHSLSIVAERCMKDCTLDFISFISDCALL